MDDDDDNDERLEDDEDEEDKNIKTYSKRKHFGKSTKDIKVLALRTNIKLHRPSIIKVLDYLFSL